jgi:glycosyltransferase involved in cell wall biosynthesis
MLLGMPCVSADVGGLPSIFEGGKDGVLYHGHVVDKNNDCDYIKTGALELENIAKCLGNAVVEMWSDEARMLDYCENARNHARKTHDSAENCRKMTEIYAEIMGESIER